MFCKPKTVSHSVSIGNGAITNLLTEIKLPLFAMERQLNSKIMVNSKIMAEGPLGPSFRSSGDETILYSEDNDNILIYNIFSGFKLFFPRRIDSNETFPTNSYDANLALRATKGDGLILRYNGLFYAFKKYSGTIWYLITVSDRNQNSVVFSRDASGMLNEIQYPGGQKLLFQNHVSGRRSGYDLVGLYDERQPIMYYDYDHLGRLIAAQSKVTISYYYQYDEQGQISQISNDHDMVARYYYDHQSRVIKVATNGAFNGDEFIYGDRETVYLPEGNQDKNICYRFGANGKILEERHPCAVVNKYFYNQLGQLVKEIDSEGHAKEYAYDENNYCTKLIDAKGGRSYAIYTTYGNLKTFIDSCSNSWSFNDDINGNLWMIYLPKKGRIDFKNNKRGQPILIIGVDGTLEQRQYDDLGRLVAVCDIHNTITRIAYDPFGRVVRLEDDKQGVTSFQYVCQKNANFWSLTTILCHASCKKHEAKYDLLGALKSLTINSHLSVRTIPTPLEYKLSRKCSLGFAINHDYANIGQVKNQLGDFAICLLIAGLKEGQTA